MRIKKTLINSSVNIMTYLLLFIPNLIVRKVFLTTLGSQILGLNSLYSNIIGWLSIAEMGIGTAIIFSLYKPFSENDTEQMNAYINFYGYIYKFIGVIFLTLGLIILPFLSFFISNDVNVSMNTVIYGFMLFLLNSFISYMFSHRLCILNVAQESYKITIGTTVSQLIIFTLQYIILKKYSNFLLYISVQLVVNLIYYIMINIYVKRRYPWIGEKNKKLDKITISTLFKNIRALFMHKIGSLVVSSTDDLVISKFVGLIQLSNYTNYNTIVVAIRRLIQMGLNGITASIGNMLNSKDKNRVYDVHKKIFFLSFWIVSFITITLYNTLNQFVGLWIGKDYLLDDLTYTVVLINFYFGAMRGSVEQFQNGSGLFYQDRYAPLAESIINLTVSLFLVKRIGIAGVFIGTLISNITVVFWTKPYVVYKYIFNESLKKYFIMYFKYLINGIIPLIITDFICEPFKSSFTITNFIINCSINVLVINIIYILLFYKSKEFKYYLNLCKHMLNKLNINKIIKRSIKC